MLECRHIVSGYGNSTIDIEERFRFLTSRWRSTCCSAGTSAKSNDINGDFILSRSTDAIEFVHLRVLSRRRSDRPLSSVTRKSQFTTLIKAIGSHGHGLVHDGRRVPSTYSPISSTGGQCFYNTKQDLDQPSTTENCTTGLRRRRTPPNFRDHWAFSQPHFFFSHVDQWFRGLSKLLADMRRCLSSFFCIGGVTIQSYGSTWYVYKNAWAIDLESCSFPTHTQQCC